MVDEAKTKADLISELVSLRQRVAHLEALETKRRQTKRAPRNNLEEVKLADDQALIDARELKVEIGERKRVEAEINRRNRQLLTLQRAGTIITSSLDLPYVLETITQEMAQLLEIEGCAISEWDQTDDSVTTVAEYGPAAWRQRRSIAQISRLVDYPLTRRVLVERRAEQLTISQPDGDPAELAYLNAAQLKTLLMLPLASQRQVIGLVEIEDSRVERTFADPEITLAQLLANQAAGAIENARLFQAERARRLEFEVMQRISLDVAASLELPDVLYAILDAVLELVPARNTHIFLYTEGRLILGTALWADGRQEQFAEPRTHGMTYTVARQGEMMVISDMRAHPLYANAPPDWQGAIIGLPLRLGQRVVGVMNIAFPQPRIFPETELRVLQLLADQAAGAIEKARLYAEIERRAQQLVVLHELDQAISASLHLDRVYEALARHTRRLLAYDHMSITRREKAGLQVVYTTPSSSSILPVGTMLSLQTSAVGWVAVKGQLLLRHHITADQHFAEDEALRRGGLQSSLVLPLRIKGQTMGTWSLDSHQVGQYGPDDLEVAQALADQLAIAMENARLYEQAEQEIRERRRVEEALRHNEALLRQILDTNPTIIFVKDSQAKIILANQALADSYQMRVAEIVGRSHREVQTEAGMSLEELEQWLADDREVISTGQPKTILEPYGHRDGSLHFNQTRKFPLDLADGSRGVLVISEDITGRKQAEEALRESEEHYRTLVETSPDAIVLTDLERVIFICNQKAASLYGVKTIIEVLGKSLLELIAPEDLPRAVDNTRQILAAGSLTNIEYTLIKKNGTRFPAELNTSLLVDQAGQPKGFISIIRDITQRKQAEARLRLLESAVVYAKDAVLITEAGLIDLPGPAILYTNEAFTQMTGYSLEEVVGQTPRLLQGPKTERGQLDKIRAALEQGEPVQVELINYRKDGSEYWVELNIVPVADTQGHFTHMISVQREVTERRQLEEQLRQSQKMDAVGQLAGGVAHDFNNILVVITGYSELLLERYLEANHPWRREIEQIQKAGERAATLTRQLLAFSRKQIFQLEVHNLNEIVTDIETMLRRLIGENIGLTTVLDPALATVKADRGQIEQVLLNLVVNARDAMPQGGKLTIETANAELDQAYALRHLDVKPGAYVMLAVSDTGIGMSAETQARIFEPFFTTKEPGKGTGLGLAMVYGIVKQSGGTLWVYSEPGHGTTFKIYLPQLTESIPSAEPDKGPAPQGAETILLVEDEAMVRALIRTILTKQGYTVLEASDGPAALRLNERHPDPIHLLLTDVVMPDMSGRELAEFLGPLRPQMKILYMSGYTDDAVIRHGVLEPGVDLLQKPFTPVNLAHKVREILDSPSKSDEVG